MATQPVLRSPNRLFIGFTSRRDARPPNWRRYDLELVKIDILNQFMTPLGSRVMLPGFGSIIWELLFEPFTTSVQQAISQDVERVINSEPRVQLLQQMSQQTSEGNGIIVTVQLKYVPFNVVDTLAMTFLQSIQSPNTLVTTTASTSLSTFA
jgi:phage baseplate assembly protein W